MEENEYALINKYIDQLPMFCNWEIDTVGYALAGIFGGVLLGGYGSLVAFAGGLMAAYLNEKLKAGKYKNFVIHVFYMIGLIQPKSKRNPPSYQRYFLR
ncbi:MAG: type IV conjugative transfer system protein TraL [Campylobacterales bacterium]|nr:type IV conjugative transfer system protein TraL [Campylobacterales bacterium]